MGWLTLAERVSADDVVLGVTPDGREVNEWALVLASVGVPYRMEETAVSWRLLVAPWDVDRARAALDAYGRDEQRRPAPPSAPVEYGPTRVGVYAALLLVAFYAASGGERSAGPWFEAGRAAAARIREGELWRALTALTLHNGAAHLAGNMAGAVVFVTAVGRALGPGLAAALVLAAGAGGNLLNAFVRPPGHLSVGASTAVFGAIGILGGLAASRRRWTRRRWVPVAGAVALLALLGTDAQADLGAHVCGLGVGVVLGVATGFGEQRPPGPAVPAGLALATLAALAGAWAVALG